MVTASVSFRQTVLWGSLQKSWQLFFDKKCGNTGNKRVCVCVCVCVCIHTHTHIHIYTCLKAQDMYFNTIIWGAGYVYIEATGMREAIHTHF